MYEEEFEKSTDMDIKNELNTEMENKLHIRKKKKKCL